MDSSPGLFRWWSKDCRIHRPCPRVKPLPFCPKEIPTAPTSPRPSLPAIDSVRTYSIVGQLDFDLVTTSESCEDDFWTSDCCNLVSKVAVLIKEDGQRYPLVDLGCLGDDSRLCCDIESRSQKLMATFLERFECSDETRICVWSIPSLVALCEIPQASPSR